MARGVPVVDTLDSGDKLGRAMREENGNIALGFREPSRFGGQTGTRLGLCIEGEGILEGSGSVLGE